MYMMIGALAAGLIIIGCLGIYARKKCKSGKRFSISAMGISKNNPSDDNSGGEYYYD